MLKDKALTRLRRDEIGFVFQSYNLVPTLTAEENILLPLAIAGRSAGPGVVRHASSRRSDSRDRLPTSRRALRRSAAAGRHRPRPGRAGPGSSSPTSPPATSTPRPGAEVLELLRRSVDEHGQTVVMVTHDPVAAAWTDRVALPRRRPRRRRAARPDPRADPRGDGQDGRPGGAVTTHDPRRPQEPAGRKVRLLLSTFAIVLGVAFVAGILIFSDTLERSFTALFASTVGDVGGPAGGQRHRPAASRPRSAPCRPASLDRPREGPRGRPRRRQRQRVRRLRRRRRTTRWSAALGPPAIGGNWTDAPAGPALGAWRSSRAARPHGRGRGGARRHAPPSGPATSSATRSRSSPRRETLELHADAGRASPASPRAAPSTARPSPLRHPPPRRSCSSTARTSTTTSGSPPRTASRRRSWPTQSTRSCRTDIEAVTGDDAADESASDLLEAISFITTFLLIFAGISLVVGSFLIVNTFSILVAQRSRELALLRALGASQRQVIWSVQLEALVLGVLGSTLGLGLGVLLAMVLRVLFAQFGLDLSGQPLIFGAAHGGRGVRRGRGGHDGRRLPAGPAYRADRARPGAPRRHRAARVVAAAAVRCWDWRWSAWGSCVPLAGSVDLFGARCRTPAGGSAPGCWRSCSGSPRPPGAEPAVPARAAGDVRPAVRPVGNLAGQNSLRNPRRTAATASALMIGLTLACTMAIVGDSAKASVDKSVEENFVGDYVVSNVFGGEFTPASPTRWPQSTASTRCCGSGSSSLEVDGGRQSVVGHRTRTTSAALELDVRPAVGHRPG